MPGWRPVRKLIRRFSAASGQGGARGPGLGARAGCEVELTEVRVAGQAWWTPGFEATGSAGLPVLLYAQRASAISRLTLGHPHDDGREVRLRLGREPVILPGPLDAPARQVAAARRGHAATGDPGTSPWLFPGAVAWQRASAGDWAAYAAEISRRKGTRHDTAT